MYITPSYEKNCRNTIIRMTNNNEKRGVTVNSIRRKALYCAGAIAAVILLLGSALTAERAESEKARYIRAEEELAFCDLCAAAEEMLRALQDGDGAALNRAAGRAEAYLSRAGLGETSGIYRQIQLICSGVGGEEECERFLKAVKNAGTGNGREALREITDGELPSNDGEEETTEDHLSSRVMERLGKGRDEISLRRARAFACPNAEFDVCDTSSPISFAYSGENVFVLVSGDTPRVMMYCFDRDTDPRYKVTGEDARRNTEMIIKREKLRLGDDPVTEECDGVYRTVYYGKGDLSDTPLVTVEIYSDTGRLRLYDAVIYYKSLN